MKTHAAVALSFALLVHGLEARAESPPPPGTALEKPKSGNEIVKFSTLWYIHGGYRETGGDGTADFRVTRGYLTAKLKPVSWFQPRITIDTYEDDDGMEVRIKYIYGKFVVPVETVVVSEPYLEFGIAHMPWLDFEEHINLYRMQGTMFMERNGLFNSGDVGLTAGVLLGEKLDEDYRRRVSPHYPGRYGSIALGVYNGAGYHDLEENDNKVFEVRGSLRPLGFVWPNLQLSYFFIYGRGRPADEPRWVNHAAMLSVEHEYFTTTATYAFGEGDQKGKHVDAAGRSLDFRGFSFFGELKLPWIWSTLFARYDWFDWDIDGGDPVRSRIIGGYAFWFYRRSALVLHSDVVLEDDETDWDLTLTLQVKLP